VTGTGRPCLPGIVFICPDEVKWWKCVSSMFSTVTLVILGSVIALSRSFKCVCTRGYVSFPCDVATP